MEIISLDGRRRLLEANVVKPGEGGAVDVLDGVIRNLEGGEEPSVQWWSSGKSSCLLFEGL